MKAISHRQHKLLTAALFEVESLLSDIEQNWTEPSSQVSLQPVKIARERLRAGISLAYGT